MRKIQAYFALGPRIGLHVFMTQHTVAITFIIIIIIIIRIGLMGMIIKSNINFRVIIGVILIIIRFKTKNIILAFNSLNCTIAFDTLYDCFAKGAFCYSFSYRPFINALLVKSVSTTIQSRIIYCSQSIQAYGAFFCFFVGHFS